MSTPRFPCSVCGREGGLLVLDGAPCMDCIRARATAAHTHRCVCSKALAQPEQHQIGSRIWIGCNRCLGSIRQLA